MDEVSFSTYNSLSLHRSMKTVADQIISMYVSENHKFGSSALEMLRKNSKTSSKGKLVFQPQDSVYKHHSLDFIKKHLRKQGYPFIKIYSNEKSDTFPSLFIIFWEVY